MWFVDQADITVRAGDGGRGCAAFAQPPYTRYPYPDGGDGGDGGDVILVADVNIATLLDFHFRHEFSAGRGGHGSGNTRQGKRGDDRVIRVPVGTVVHDRDAGTVVRDLAHADEQAVVARGGHGGMGNAAIVAGIRSGLPRWTGASTQDATPGERGETRRLTLELKLIADAGLIGCPNAGKSSLLARLSSAKPKIGAYPFTTRYPVLGVVQVGDRGSFVACDIPGLIEGAHEGKGLGIQFLRHIERTRVLLHLVDIAAVDGRDPVEAYHVLNEELASYSEALTQKPQMVVANKMDLPEAAHHLSRFRQAVGAPVWPVSCATGEGLGALVEAIWEQVRLAGGVGHQA